MANWEKKADKELKRVILAVGHCERCMRSDRQLHHHHIVSRNHKAYRHDLTNCLCLCASCHTMAPDSAHNDRTAFLKWIETQRPGVWAWFLEHHTVETEVIANEERVRYRPIRIEHRGDEVEYNELREI